MPTARVNGTDLYYEDSGAGFPLLFVHGMCGNANVWDDQVARLSRRFRCIAYDRRGHTRSPLGEVPQRTVELHGDDAAALITELQIAPCLLVSSSGGARIGIDLLHRHSQLFAGAVLSEPPLFHLDPEGARSFVAELQPRMEAAVQTGGPRAAVDAFFDYVCPGLWRQIDESRKDLYRANHEELFGDLQMPPYRISLEELSAMSVPCRIVTGADSRPLFRHVVDVLAATVPRAKRIEIAGSGHVTYAEQPQRFAEIVATFGDELGL